MTLAEFRRTLSEPKPPVGLALALAALWWAGKDDWDKAHKIVMDEEGGDSAWVHAYLHRIEGDLPNAKYWYAQARQTGGAASLEAEWESIAGTLIARADHP